ncbi:hypothetical protein FGG08_003803 [Glutinoglossum americanum]|uniref:Ubiquitin-like domain-containing protein n=1 Tax=Glutinoglossum americanum TaxID=1670608 RepID=A0A9P8I6B3_9PEZI|nr:hypothetical protein FGG08_003803 [Glutinoglossum americanum]
MDPLSVAASVVGLLLAGGKMAGLLSKMTSLTDAPALARAVLTEMSDISAALRHTQDFLRGAIAVPAERRQYILLEHLVATLTGCVTTYSELEPIVDSLRIGASDMGAFDRVKWSVKENEIRDIVQRLQNHKSSLNLMLTILQCSSSHEIQQSVTRLCGLVEQAVRSNGDLSMRLSRLEGNHTLSSGASNVVPIYDDDGNDSATIRPVTTTNGNQPDIVDESAITTFAFDSTLKKSRVYSRVNFIRSDSHSESSLVSSDCKTAAISIFSSRSLSEVSNLSVYSLPICLGDINNRNWYIEIEIRVKLYKMVHIKITPNTTCLDLKQKVYDKGGWPPDQQFLVFSSKKIPDNAILMDIGIRDGSLVHEILRCAWRGIDGG